MSKHNGKHNTKVIFYSKKSRMVYDFRWNVCAFDVVKKRGYFPTLEPKEFTTSNDVLTWMAKEKLDNTLIIVP